MNSFSIILFNFCTFTLSSFLLKIDEKAIWALGFDYCIFFSVVIVVSQSSSGVDLRMLLVPACAIMIFVSVLLTALAAC